MTLAEIHLFEVSKRITSEHERTELGLKLRISGNEIAIAKLNNPNDSIMANYEMLKIWFKRTSDRNDAWEELENALRKCKLNQILAEVLTVKES